MYRDRWPEMGEAKRRKQLGLMPTVENHEVIFHRDGTVEANTLPPAVLERLTTWADTGARWDARYRTSFVGVGLPREMLNTDDDLRAIPVPERMRIGLGLLSGSPAWLERELELNPDSFFEEDGEQKRQLNVRTTEYDFGGQWGELPEFEPDGTLRYLMQHPAVMAEVPGTDYMLTAWRGGERDGEVNVDPEPDAEHRAALEQAARTLVGDSDEDWLEDHQEMLDDELTEENEAAPLARRLTLRLSPVPLVLSPAVRVLERSGDMDVLFRQGGEAYSHDGVTWTDYPEVVDRDAQLRALMAQMGLGDVDGAGGLEALLGSLGAGGLEDQDSDDSDPDDRTIEAEVVDTSGRDQPGETP